jgi:formiminotetrahydrofolate cyclodeaminase
LASKEPVPGGGGTSAYVGAIEIAQETPMRPICEVAAELGIDEKHLEL